MEEGLVYHKVLDKQEGNQFEYILYYNLGFILFFLGRILSLCWHSSGEFIVTGSSDAIRVWNVETGHAVNRMSPGRSERNKVWINLECLSRNIFSSINYCLFVGNSCLVCFNHR